MPERLGLSLERDDEVIREEIERICADFPDTYWQSLEEGGDYPSAFVDRLTSLGWLSILIPEEYGGGGRGITSAAVVLEAIHRSGGNANACHAQMYTMATVLRHGSTELKQRFLPEIAGGRLRLQAFAITEPNAGSDTTKISTRAVPSGDGYLVSGEKVYISRVEYSDLMLLLARTGDVDGASKRGAGLSVFLVDLRDAKPGTITWRRIPTTFNHHTYQVFFDELHVQESQLVGTEGEGFKYILESMNAERILIASEAIGDGHYFVDRAAKYSRERIVFGQPIGANQGVQFPVAQAYAQVHAASLARFQAAAMFDAGVSCGQEANAAKLLASQASWAAANAAVTTFGGNAFATEYGIERKFREAKLLEIAPVSNNLVLSYLGAHVLGMPRSY